MRKIFLYLLAAWMLTAPAAGHSVKVPILMYHHFTEESTASPNECSAARFREHIAALSGAGYHTVTFADLLGFVYNGTELPQKPVLLTSDDGYASVPERALPILQEYGMGISVAVIGGMAGKVGLIPHFSLEEAEVWKGTVEPVSHTWQMHERNDCCYGVLTSAGTLHPAFLRDFQKIRQAADSFPMMGQVFVYPYGKYSAESEAVLTILGYRVSVTTEYGIAEVTAGVPDTLRLLPRIGVCGEMTAETLLAALDEP